MKLKTLIPALGLALPGTDFAAAAEDKAPSSYEITDPPACVNYLGADVSFIDVEGRKGAPAMGMAARDPYGNPVIYRFNHHAAPPSYQLYIDMHECGHHQTGDVDRPVPRQHSDEHMMNEANADCIATLRIRDEKDNGRAILEEAMAFMRAEMTALQYPEIHIGGRIANTLDNCYNKDASPGDFIRGVLEHRGLTQ